MLFLTPVGCTKSKTYYAKKLTLKFDDLDSVL